MTHRRSGGLFIALSTLGLVGISIGCGGTGSSPSGMSSTESTLYADRNHLWTQDKTIPICWANDNTGNDAQRKREAKDAIEGAWTRKAGIHFSGWESCPLQGRGIVLEWVTTGDGRSSTDFIGQHNDRAQIHFDQNASNYAFIHEMGHALGFAHEQNRPDNKGCLPCRADDTCDDPKAHCDIATKFCHQGSDGTNPPMTTFDYHSIMEYTDNANNCHHGDTLSPLDVEGTRLSYPLLRPMKIMTAADLCLGVKGFDSHGAGTLVEGYPCAPIPRDPKVDEGWSLRPTTDGYSRIVNLASGLCLGIVGVDSPSDDNASVEVYHCDPVSDDAREDEEWKIVDIGEGFVNIVSHVGGYLLAVPQAIPPLQYGKAVSVFVMDPRSHEASVAWRIVDLPVTHGRTTMKLANFTSRLCIDTPGVDVESGPTRVSMHDCSPNWEDGKQDQEWEIVPTTGDYFRLKNANNGLCLGVEGADDRDPTAVKGRSVEIYSCTPTGSDAKEDEEWMWDTGVGQNWDYARRLRNRATGLCLGVKGFDDHGAGAELEVYGCDETSKDQKLDENWIGY